MFIFIGCTYVLLITCVLLTVCMCICGGVCVCVCVHFYNVMIPTCMVQLSEPLYTGAVIPE